MSESWIDQAYAESSDWESFRQKVEEREKQVRRQGFEDAGKAFRARGLQETPETPPAPSVALEPAAEGPTPGAFNVAGFQGGEGGFMVGTLQPKSEWDTAVERGRQPLPSQVVRGDSVRRSRRLPSTSSPEVPSRATSQPEQREAPPLPLPPEEGAE